MNLSDVVEISYGFPIERIRGGEVIVSVNCKFKNGIVTSGFALSLKDTEDSILQAQDKAIANALVLANKIGEPSKTEQILVEAIKQVYLPQVRTAFEEKKDNGLIEDSKFGALFEQTDDIKQRDLNNLCDALGIARIDAIGNGWTLIETITLISALSKVARVLEAK